MKKKIVLLLFVLTSQCLYARDVVYQFSDSVKVVRFLRDAQLQPRQTNFAIFFARKFIGVPYVAHTLENPDEEKLIINLRQMDCTTLVENVTALTLCALRHEYSFRAFCTNLASIRYRNGYMQDYTSRLHYFSEWIDDNSKRDIVTEIQSPNPPFAASKVLKLNYISNHPSSYEALQHHTEYIPRIREAEQRLTGKEYRYIPKSLVGESSQKSSCIDDGDILAIVTNKDGLDVAHVGIAVWNSDGLHMINASSVQHKVVEDSVLLVQYLKRKPTDIGIRVVRIMK